MPENTVNVARGPGRKWGNPWARGMFVRDGAGGLKRLEDEAELVRLFAEMFGSPPARESVASRADLVGDAEAVMKYPAIAEIRAELAGKNLACWCPLDRPCHADTLLRVANGGEI